MSCPGLPPGDPFGGLPPDATFMGLPLGGEAAGATGTGGFALTTFLAAAAGTCKASGELPPAASSALT